MIQASVGLHSDANVELIHTQQNTGHTSHSFIMEYLIIDRLISLIAVLSFSLLKHKQ